MRPMRRVLALCLVLAFSAGTLRAAPVAASALADAPAAGAVVAGGVVAPVPGQVVRDFDPPLTRYSAGHRGVDLAAVPGEPVVAALGGIVTFSGMVAGTGWVTVDHGGDLDTTYGPVAVRLAGSGDRVAAGQLLGFLAAGADHLDWGARLAGDYIDPLSLLRRWETYLTTDTDDPALVAAARGLGVVAPAFTGTGAWVRPAAGPVTSGFGSRRHPVTGEHRHHAGLDIGAPAGAPVVAAAGGTVTFAGAASGYGTTVIVDHGGGRSTLYAHLGATAVRAGQGVSAGQRIGAVGATGVATGPHLHVEVRVHGVAQDPAPLLGG